jgi:hypothetical protein
MAEQQTADATRLAERMAGIIAGLEKEAQRRVGQKRPFEDRALEDLRQYHGIYDPEVEQELSKSDRSQLFIGKTRKITDAWSARLGDLLFPTDERNWEIKPTPVPRLAEAVKQAVQMARQKAEQAKAAQEAAEMNGATPEQAAAAQQAKADAQRADNAASLLNAEIEEGRRRANLMMEEIDDQLKESLYHAIMRDVIEDACKLGAGIAKGPVTGDKVRKGWQRQPVMETATDDAGNAVQRPKIGADGKPVLGEYALQTSAPDKTPAMRWVDWWSFFPDLDVKNPQDGEGNYERHLLNGKRLRALAKLPGFDKDAIRRLLKDGATTGAPAFLAELRSINKETSHQPANLFHVWEYSGPIRGEDLRDLAEAVGDEAMMQDAGEIDPLDEVHAVVWFCQGELLKLSIYPLDSGECLYSVFNVVKDESTCLGISIPRLIRDPERALAAGWRGMMDNTGRAAGPMFVWAKDHIEPEDGEWTVRPWKNWLASGDLPQTRKAVEVVQINPMQEALANVIQMAADWADEMAMMPAVAQGEQGVGKDTYGGQVIKMNSANVGFRRIVKNFDDDMTTPNIRRMYDWNMQFNPKQEIKGDYEIDARGSSVLLVRELQSQSLMWIAMNLGAHPVFGPMLRNRVVLRKLFQTMMVPSDEVVLTDEEIDQILAQASAADAAQQQAAAAANAEAAKLNLQLDVATIDAESRVRVAEINRETAIIGYATKANVEVDKLEAMLMDRREDRAAKQQSLMVEAGVAAATGEHAGGAI